MKPDDKDYEAIHKNSNIHGISDLVDFACMIANGILRPKQIQDYVAKRTDVAFTRGYWKCKKGLK